MPGDPDYRVELVDANGDPDMSVAVVGDIVVDLTGASAGDVLTVQPDGTVAADPAAGGGVASVNGDTGPAVVLDATDVGAQPVDADLTAIAALTTAAFGRSLLTAANLAALRTAIGLNIVHVRDEKAQDTAGGTATSGSWQTRTLNTVKTNEITGASLAANAITLPAGTYDVWASAPAFNCNRNQARLFDVTGNAALVVGTSEFARTGAASDQVRSFVVGRFTLAVQSDVRLEHQVETTMATTGFGLDCNFATEVYSECRIVKVA